MFARMACLPLSLMVFLFCASGQAFAQGATTDLTVRVIVPEQCMVRAEDLDFGIYNPHSGARSSAQLRVRCTIGVPYEITLSEGSSGTVGNRTMVQGSDALPYQLYSDPAATQVWGSTAGGGTVGGTGVGSERLYRVHGKIEPGHFVADGVYVDSVVVTVHY